MRGRAHLAGTRPGRAAGVALLLALAGLATTQPGLAQTVAERMPACLGCHGAAGTSKLPGVPSLGAMPADYVLVQLYLFRERQRVVAPMNAMAAGLSDDDLREMGDKVASLAPPVPAGAPLDAAALERVQALVGKHRCASCHNADFAGHDQIPRIAGQREEYLLHSLQGYKDNSRPGYDATMSEVTQEMKDADLPLLARYLAQYR